MAGIGVQDL